MSTPAASGTARSPSIAVLLALGEHALTLARTVRPSNEPRSLLLKPNHCGSDINLPEPWGMGESAASFWLRVEVLTGHSMACIPLLCKFIECWIKWLCIPLKRTSFDPKYTLALSASLMGMKLSRSVVEDEMKSVLGRRLIVAGMWLALSSGCGDSED